MVKRILKICVWIIVIAIMIPALLFALLFTGVMEAMIGLNSVVPNYKWCVGIVYDGIIDYDYVRTWYGEPDNIEILSDTPMPGRYTIYISHGMLTFKFGAANIEEYSDTAKWELYTIKTRNPEHHFGKAKIHVGSTRDEVIQAYSKLDPKFRSAMGNQYYDGYWGQYVTFEYDENDIVTSIEFVD